MKKILLATVAVLGVTSFHAAQAQESTFASPYVGVYGGYGWTDADNSNGADPSPDGVDYGIYGGVKVDSLLNQTINRTGLGLTGALEVHYGGSSADDTVSGVNIEKGREYGISFKPGMSFLNTDSIINVNPYAIVGYRNTEYEAKVAGLSADETYHGFELGIGTELVAYDDMAIRADYTHVWYGEENGIDPDEDNLRIGVGYNF